MSKYLKLFQNHSGYTTYMNGGEVFLPNVSYCETEMELHYNPIVDPYNGKSYVDLGLSSGTKWARTNVGATVETDYGLYFAWGETTGYTSSQVGTDKNFSWSDYELGDGQSSAAHMTKYNSTDGKTTLDLEDDAAHVNMGGDWHMPSKEQMLELVAETTNGFVASNGTFTQFAWSSEDGYSEPTETTASTGNTFGGVAGHLFFKSDVAIATALANGEYLFIPASGFCYIGSVHDVGVFGYVWSSSLSSENALFAWSMSFDEGSLDVDYGDRYPGCTVRGVVGEIAQLPIAEPTE